MDAGYFIRNGIIYGGGIVATSNPNLLDNPWFTVNQRGASQYTAIGYTVDRWRQWVADTVRVSNNGVSAKSLYTYLENGITQLILGKTITLSIMFSDGTIKSSTAQMPNSMPSSQTSVIETNVGNNNTFIYVTILSDGSLDVHFANWADVAVDVRAMKLEIGSVSTLHLDTAPNYASELLKCMRYFQRHVQNSNISLIGYALPNSIGNLLTTSVRLFVPMRTIPTVSVSAVTDFYYGNHTSYTSMTDQPTSITRNGGTYQDISVAFGGMTGLTVGQLYALAGKGYIDFTADL